MKNKEFDDFSFKAPTQSQQSIGQISQKSDKMHQNMKHQPPKQIRYRHLQTNMQKSPPALFDIQINKRISQISEELDENIKRRLELQKKLNLVKKQVQNKQQREIFMAYNDNTYKSPEEEAREFNEMNKRVDHVDKMVKGNQRIESKQKIIEKNKELLLDFQEPASMAKQQILIPIIQKLSKTSKSKPLPVYTVPDQIKIQTLLRKATFPQLPKGNLEELQKQIQKLYAVHSSHSDIHYLLMAIYFHLQKFMKVRKNYEQIQNFKIFNVKAHWIAAQAQFQMKNYDLCLKLTEECMNKVGQKYLPRFIYLKAKSFEQIGNYVNSVICFNQLTKMKPNISEYYLERGIIYHRIGYYKESKEDFVTFGILKPNAQQFIKEKVLCQKNEHRKKEYISLLAQMF